jgi:translation elongation factor EF-Ts
MAGRIEVYLHSDSVTPNKGGCLVKVECQTDFAAKTNELINFSKICAKLCFASGQDKWLNVIEVFPELETSRTDLVKLLKETVTITDIVSLTL